MLKNEIRDSSLFTDLSPIAESLGLTLVDVHKNVISHDEIQICIVVFNRMRDTSIEDCEKLHRTVQPRLELLFGRDVLSMEVSTPGLLRNFKDCYEFEVFKEKLCRVYSISNNSWIEGIIGDTDDNSVELFNYTVIDSNISGDRITLCFDDIQKAKLDYTFVNNKSGDK